MLFCRGLLPFAGIWLYALAKPKLTRFRQATKHKAHASLLLPGCGAGVLEYTLLMCPDCRLEGAGKHEVV